MKLNESKTNEMVICFKKNAPPLEPIVINERAIERVSKTKLLGVIISNDLTWDEHIMSICKKACGRIYQLYPLKRAGVSVKDLILIYFTTIRPVLEYACPVWHPGLNAKLSSQLENIQKRIFKIILPTHTYTKALEHSGAPTLKDRRSEIKKSFFVKMTDPNHKLYHMISPVQTPCYNTCSQSKYPLLKCRTSRYKNSFIPYCLFYFQ